jgi:hypothetical protein
MEERSALVSPMSKCAMENHRPADHKMVIKGSKCAPGRGNPFERPRRTSKKDFCFHSELGGLCLGREGGGGKSRDFKIISMLESNGDSLKADNIAQLRKLWSWTIQIYLALSVFL